MTTRLSTVKLYALILSLFFAISFPFHVGAGAPQGSEKPVAAGRTKKPFFEKYARQIMGLTFLQVLLFSERMKDGDAGALQQQCGSSHLFKNFLTQYCSYCAATICHELGHALVAKVVNDDPFEIHLGGRSEDDQNPLFEFKGIFIDGLSPVLGHAVFTQPYKNKKDVANLVIALAVVRYCKEQNINITEFSSVHFNQDRFKELCSEVAKSEQVKNEIQVDKVKLTAILLAGGLCGIAGHCLIRFIISFVCGMCQSDGSFSRALLQAFSDSTRVDSVIISQLSNMLLPFKSEQGSGSDAFKVYDECLGINEELLKNVGIVAPFGELAAEYFLTEQTQGFAQPDFSKKLGVAFVNYMLRGFFRFSA